MSFMETNNGASSSYNYRGGRGWGGNRGRGGRNFAQEGGGYQTYDQENYQPRGGRQSSRGRGYQSYGGNYEGGTGNTWNDSGSSRRGNYRGRGSNYWGNQRGGGRYQGRGGRGRGRGFFDDPEDVQFLKVLKGHTDGVTSLAVNESTGQLFTGSKDQSVRLWDFQTGQCLKTVEVGGEVDSMLLESGFLFVGLHAPGQKAAIQSLPGSVKVFNLAAGSEYALMGHMGPVYALAAASNMLFSGGHDQSIRVWQFNQPAGLFEAAAVLTAAQGGHAVEVKALQVIGRFLFSADFQGIIKVWDMDSGQCTQTIQAAHQAVVMSLLAWQGFLLSGSIDGLIRIWQIVENPQPGAVLEPQPAYSHPPVAGPLNPEGEEMYGKVLTLSGTQDAEGTPVLLSSYSSERVVRLWQLPDFADRGHLNAITNSVAVASWQAFLFAGDYSTGNVKVWKWRAPGMAG